MTGNGEVTKRRVREGVGEFPVDCPLEDCAVRVHFTARAAGTDTVRLDGRTRADLLAHHVRVTLLHLCWNRLGYFRKCPPRM